MVVALKNEELRPIIEDIFDDTRAINDAIKNKDGSKRRSCSKKFRDAITYAVNKEFKLKLTFRTWTLLISSLSTWA